MSAPELRQYDGGAGFLVDSNIWIDCIDADSAWHARAVDCLQQCSALPWSCAALAATAFRLYRQRGGTRRTPLPDFHIGAHAAVANLSVVTRDQATYRSYFPRLKRISPA